MDLREQFIIELRGVGFVNKGAELMLMAIINKVSNKFPDARFVMEPRTDSPYEKRGALGLYQKLAFKKRNGKDYFGFLADFIPKNIRTSYGIISEDEIDIVIDASGFAYSEQFGVQKTRIAANEFQRIKKKGAKIILLPQAFGPFNSQETKAQFRKLINNVDIAFARDQVSYDHVIGTVAVGDDQKIFTAPDFTNLLEGHSPEKLNHLSGRICVIPNNKMVEKVEPNGRSYVDFLSTCLRELIYKGENPFILLHEVGRDHELVREILNKFETEVEVISVNDPLLIKGIIGGCKGVISSRFHGLVSSLSQGIPALATGWSHKYQMLFDDYKFTEGCISIELTNEEISDKIKLLTDSSKVMIIRNKLKVESERQKKLSMKMWDMVFSLMRK